MSAQAEARVITHTCVNDQCMKPIPDGMGIPVPEIGGHACDDQCVMAQFEQELARFSASQQHITSLAAGQS